MTQQLQDEFDSSVENAEAWMKAIQERLRINDNTKGPRSALEARLRETEVREERWNSEVALTAAIVTAVIAVNSRVFHKEIVSCPCLLEHWTCVDGFSSVFFLIFPSVKCLQMQKKEDGNLISQASKLFRLIWNTSSRFGRLKCLHSPQAWNNLVAACNYHSNLQTSST